jgi:hypothetical protein
MLNWLESVSLRKSCQAGLNKSEQRHALAQIICTFKQGRIADRGHEGQQFRASGLNLVIAAIAARYPQVPGVQDFAPAGERGWRNRIASRYWGLTPQEYYDAADLWPLDP